MMSGTTTHVHLGGMELDQALTQVESAGVPEDLFGPVTVATGPVKRIYRKLSFVLHPDQAQAGDDVDRMTAAFSRLSQLWETWQLAATTGAPTTAASQPQTKAAAEHPFGKKFATGTYATLYAKGDLITKVVREPKHNAKMVAERETLARIATFVAEPDNQWLAPFFSFPTETMDFLGHEVTTFNRLGGFYTLDEVNAAYPNGIEGRDWAWMMRKLLMILSAADTVHRTHGALTRENIMVNPTDHRVVLVGWTESADGDDHDDALSLARLGTTMLNSDVDSMAQHKWLVAVQRYPSRAYSLLSEYDKILRDLYGTPKFHPFAMPRTTR